MRLGNHCQSLSSEGDVMPSESRQVVAPNKGSRLWLATSLEVASCSSPLTPLSRNHFKRCPVRDIASVEMAPPFRASDLNSKYRQVTMEVPLNCTRIIPSTTCFPTPLASKRDPRLQQFYILTSRLFHHLFACYVVYTHECAAWPGPSALLAFNHHSSLLIKIHLNAPLVARTQGFLISWEHGEGRRVAGVHSRHVTLWRSKQSLRGSPERSSKGTK